MQLNQEYDAIHGKEEKWPRKRQKLHQRRKKLRFEKRQQKKQKQLPLRKNQQ